MIIAGDDRQLFHLRIPRRQDPPGTDRVLRGGQRLVLHDHAPGVHAVRDQPFRHFPGFRGVRILSRGSAAGADKEGRPLHKFLSIHGSESAADHLRFVRDGFHYTKAPSRNDELLGQGENVSSLRRHPA